MIVNNGMKADAFVSAIACTIARDDHARIDAEQITPDAIEDSREGVIYLAGGYWRGRPTWDDSGKLIGLDLINPDRTSAEIRAVEHGIAILIHCDYL